MRIILTSLVLLAVAIGGWAALQGSLGASDSPLTVPLAAVLSMAVVIAAATSERRVRADLGHGQRSSHGLGTELVRSSTGVKGGLTGMAISGMARSALDLGDVLAAGLAVALVPAAAGWLADAHLAAGWVGGPVLAALASWTLARRIACWRGADLRARDLRDLMPGKTAQTIALGAFSVSGAGWWMLSAEPAASVAVALLAGGVVFGSAVAWGAGKMQKAKRRIQPIVAAALGVSDSVMLAARWAVVGDRIRIHAPMPAPIVSHLPGLRERVAERAPMLSVVDASPEHGVTLSGVTAEDQTERDLLSRTEGMVVGQRPAPASPTRPEAVTWLLAPSVRNSDAGRLAAVAQALGLSLIEIDADAHRAVVARLDPATLRVRNRVAEVLQVEPWRVEVAVRTAPREEGGLRPDRVLLTRWPAPADAEKRYRVLRQITQALPDGSFGWQIDDRAARGEALLVWGPVPRLPKLVPLADLLPESVDPDSWAHLPLGVGPDGAPRGINLQAGPHALVVGPTGSGKTIGLQALMVNALARGHRLVIIEATKGGVDFTHVTPWCTAVAGDLSSAAAAMLQVYEEGARRKALLRQYGEAKWIDLPAEVREREDIHPLTVLIDEVSSTVEPAEIPKGLEKDHPLVVEGQALNVSKALIKAYMGKIARELRFVGIFLQIGTQRPDAAFLGGEVRSNLTSRVQLSAPGMPPDRTALAMVFDPEVIEAAGEQIHILDDGASPGLAIVAAEGGTARGLRVAYANPSEVPALLDRVGVPRVDAPWDLSGGLQLNDRDLEVIDLDHDPAAPAETIDLGEMDLGDLELDDDAPASESGTSPAKNRGKADGPFGIPADPPPSTPDDWGF